MQKTTLTLAVDVIVDRKWYELGFDWKKSTLDAATTTLMYYIASKDLLSSKKYSMSILLSDDGKLQQFNKLYRNIDKPTNVLSFQYIDWYGNMETKIVEHISNDIQHYEETNDDVDEDDSYHNSYGISSSSIILLDDIEQDEIDFLHLGDIMVSYQHVINEAIDQKISYKQHLSFLVTHGTLHLLGYDHIYDDDAKEMQCAEKEIMQLIPIK